MRRVLMACLVLLAIVEPVKASQDVRVVLDLSQSMNANDPNRLALLATMLFYDLARPNPSLRDSFVVLPFDRDWSWPDAAATPPVSGRPRIEARVGGRQDFQQAVLALPYDARMTYFYPGILAALDDLEKKTPSPYDLQTILLVTDGVPEPATRDAELQRIREELGPRLERRNIRLYVLAFGLEADRNQSFFADMVHSPKGISVGDVFVDANGSELLNHMLEIFSRSFGFTPDTARQVPGTSTLDLNDSTTPDAVAVAVLTSGAQTPSLSLTPPPRGGVVNAPEGVQSAASRGGSYSLLWVFGPDAGEYGLSSSANPGTVAVLRKIRLALEIRPAPPHAQVDRTLAGIPFPLRILVHSANGAQSDPGPVELSFRTFGERLPQPGPSGSAYTWESNRSGPAAAAGTLTSEGRVYDIVTEFREHDERLLYVGNLEVEARRGGKVVGSLSGTQAHSVEVHPLLAVSPLPLSAYASNRALGRREEACVQFALHLDAGQLPHPERPSYSLRAVLVVADPNILDRELRQASFTLDGLPLGVEGKPGPVPGAWYVGRPVAAGDILRRHDLCVRTGKPAEGDPAKALELKLVTTLLEDPYDDFRVIQPFNLKILVAPPTLFERWRVALLSALGGFIVLSMVWYLRDRPVLARDLGYAIGREDSTAALASQPFDEPAMPANLFGWIAEGSIVAPGEDRPLGRVRPVDQELFRLRPARGVQVESLRRDEAIERRGGLVTIAVHRTYRLRSERASYLFRLEYQ